nr:MAG TPA: hypothetical protein [Caudoviricetes sp.]
MLGDDLSTPHLLHRSAVKSAAHQKEKTQEQTFLGLFLWCG